MATVSGNIIRVAARQLLNARDEVVNVHHFTVQTTGTGGDQGVLDEVGGKMSLAWVELDQIITIAQEPNIIDVYNVSQDYPLGQVTWGSAYTGGTASGDGMPFGVAALVIWSTATKRVQGKTYLGSISEAAVTNAAINGTSVTAIAAFCDVLTDDAAVVNDWDLRLGVWSRSAGQMRPITARRISTNPAYQRRRRAGRGS